MADYTRHVKSVLSANNCVFVRHGKGDHDIWHSPINNKNFPVDSQIKSRVMANEIMKQAGVTYKF